LKANIKESSFVKVVYDEKEDVIMIQALYLFSMQFPCVFIRYSLSDIASQTETFVLSN